MLKNNRILRVLATVMTVIMVACAFAGCSAVVQDPVVAKVGDVEILYSTFYNAFSTYAQYGIIDTSNSETAKDGRQMIMDMLVNSVVPVAEAHKLGMELTEDQQRRIVNLLMAWICREYEKTGGFYGKEKDRRYADFGAETEKEDGDRHD